jgi:hypothetical protein
MSYFVLPMVNPRMYRAINGFTITWLAAHALYGFILGFAPMVAVWMRRRYVQRRRTSAAVYDEPPRRVALRREEQL